MVFERLFGDGGTQRAAPGAREESRQHSRFGRWKKPAAWPARLGNSDRSKLSEYLDSVREIEQRIQNTEKQDAQNLSSCRTVPSAFRTASKQHTKLMFDLQIMAFRADLTRVFSMIMARELSGRTYPMIGIPGQHHLISHHRDDADLMSQKARIDTYHVQMLAYFLEKMAGHAGRRRLAARPQPDHVRQRHGQRQSASPFRSAGAAGRQAGRQVQDRLSSATTRWTRRWRTCW